VAEFSASPVRGRSPLPVVFQDLSSGAVTSWLWDFGDGTTSTERNPTHLYRFGGLYTVRLTVTGRCGVHAAEPREQQHVRPRSVEDGEAVRGAHARTESSAPFGDSRRIVLPRDSESG